MASSYDLDLLLRWTNLNSCLDEATEIALLPSFNGCIGDIRIPGTNYDAMIIFQQYLNILSENGFQLKL